MEEFLIVTLLMAPLEATLRTVKQGFALPPKTRLALEHAIRATGGRFREVRALAKLVFAFLRPITPLAVKMLYRKTGR